MAVFAFRVRGTNTPVATIGLVAVTVAVFLLQLVPGLGVTDALLFAPIYALGELQAQGIPYEPWRMVTDVFAHSAGGGTFFFLHILFNMYTLWIFGQVLETMLGRARFIALYLLAGLGGSLLVFYWSFVDRSTILTAVVGASGAVFGLMAAYLVIQRHFGADTRGMLVLVGINLVLGFLPGTNISWQAHVGGIIVGALVGLIVTKSGRNPLRQRWLLVGFSFVLVALALSHAPIIVGA
jgi:membrane associated rhomboid family serine protease